MERIVTIPCGDIRLEGRFERMDGKSAAVVLHPHPLYGGDMDNPVVTTIAGAYKHRGFSTLRLNFRGVGGSGGAFDNGRGEELDILACFDFLKAQGIDAIDLAGYSFGAWVMAKLSPLPDGLSRMLMAAPPVAFMDFSDITSLPPDIRTITGSLDEFAPTTKVEKWLMSCGVAGNMDVVRDADHFFTGCLQQLEDAVLAVI
jgi:alpha/beta superfamily hydrolase